MAVTRPTGRGVPSVSTRAHGKLNWHALARAKRLKQQRPATGISIKQAGVLESSHQGVFALDAAVRQLTNLGSATTKGDRVGP